MNLYSIHFQACYSICAVFLLFGSKLIADSEPGDDTRSGATPVTIPDSGSGSFQSPNDIDFYRVKNEVGYRTLRLFLSSPGATSQHVVMRVFADDGTTLLKEGYVDFSDTIRFSLPAPKQNRDFFIRISGLDPGISYSFTTGGSGLLDSAKKAKLRSKIRDLQSRLRKIRGGKKTRVKKQIRRLKQQLRKL